MIRDINMILLISGFIGTFPAKNIDIEEYPTIKEYLESFGKVIRTNGGKFY